MSTPDVTRSDVERKEPLLESWLTTILVAIQYTAIVNNNIAHMCKMMIITNSG